MKGSFNMSLIPASRGIDRRALLSAFAALSGSLLASPARAQSATVGTGFSFAAVGDTRPMMYLPQNQGEPDYVKLFVEMFGLVMPEKVAEEVVAKYVKMTFDPDTKELIRVIMPFATKTEVMTLTVDKGWVTEAVVEDVKLLPGVHRTMFRLQGGDWVAREVAANVKSGRAKFVLHTGDLVWWGKQSDKPSDNMYWKLLNENVLKQLPRPDKEMRT